MEVTILLQEGGEIFRSGVKGMNVDLDAGVVVLEFSDNPHDDERFEGVESLGVVVG